MNKYTLTILLTLQSIYISAQQNEFFLEKRPLNNVAVNICGDASLISFHYERIFLVNPNLFLAGKLGVGFDEPTIRYLLGYSTPPENYFITIPHHITCNFGKRKHFFEIGLGGSLVWEASTRNYLLYPVVGYRLQPLKTNAVNLRIYGTLPFSGNEEVKANFTPLGLSLGICF